MPDETVWVEQDMKDVVSRTSSNNMLALVEYIPLTEEEQKLVDEIFAIAA
jgi:hypothetical protein